MVCGYIGANLWLVLGDIQELNGVHLRTLQRAVRQNRELRAADHALRGSRRRLLVAADEERVRLERDLHDGAQQRLVSLSLQLRLAAELAEDRAVAERLHLSEKSVEKHINSIFSKLHLTDQPESNRRVRSVLAWLAEH